MNTDEIMLTIVFRLQGPAFGLAILSDDTQLRLPQPNVRTQYFSNVATRTAADVNSAISALRLTMQVLAASLHGIVRDLLKKVGPRISYKLLFEKACCCWLYSTSRSSLICAEYMLMMCSREASWVRLCSRDSAERPLSWTFHSDVCGCKCCAEKLCAATSVNIIHGESEIHS